MDTLSAAAAIITLAALFSWINHRYIHQPATVALLLFSLVLSLGLVALGKLGLDPRGQAQSAMGAIELDRVLLESVLSFVLFAGALHVDLGELERRKWPIGFLASIGVVISAGIAGSALWGIWQLLGHPMPFIYCLLFGALISPTDPIAVLALLKSARAERSLQIKMAGEALLNDGFGIVLFVLFLGIAMGGEQATFGNVALLFAREVIGGGLFGLVIGYVAYRMLASINNHKVEILLTLALVMGGYATALALHVSGPIAIVVAGILIGNQARKYAMSQNSRQRLDEFWELVDEILVAVLFVMIGLELLSVEFDAAYAWAAALAIPAVLAARFISIAVARLVPALREDFPPYVIGILTWGGLRGGISVALALSLPAGPHRDAIITVTYVVVLFSILVQGLTLSKLLRRRRPGSTP